MIRTPALTVGVFLWSDTPAPPLKTKNAHRHTSARRFGTYPLEVHPTNKNKILELGLSKFTPFIAKKEIQKGSLGEKRYHI